MTKLQWINKLQTDKRVTMKALNQKSESRMWWKLSHFFNLWNWCFILILGFPWSSVSSITSSAYGHKATKDFTIRQCKIDFEISKIKEAPPQDYHDDDDCDNAQIKAHIRCYIHYNKKHEKSEFVESRYQYNGRELINRKPACVHDLIAEGIKHIASVKV